MAARNKPVFTGPRHSLAIELITIPSRLGGASYELEIHRFPDGSLAGLRADDFPPGERTAHSPKTGEVVQLGHIRGRRSRQFSVRVSPASMTILRRLYELAGKHEEPRHGTLLPKAEQEKMKELLRHHFVGVWDAEGIRIYHITKLGQQYYRFMQEVIE